MNPIFLATLGQRPEAITIALDALQEQYKYQAFGLIHTDRHRSGISQAYRELTTVLQSDYPQLEILSFEVRDTENIAVKDIQTEEDAQNYYRYLVQLLKFYREKLIPVHLLIAGGRKAMSVYATLAASVLFGPHDRVMTVLSPPGAMIQGQFHAPEKYRRDIQVVELPLQPSRFLPGILSSHEVEELLTKKRDLQQEFYESLTDKERDVVNQLHTHPYASNSQLAKQLGKKKKTIDNQLNTIYSKLAMFFNLDSESRKKRQALLDVLAGRL